VCGKARYQSRARRWMLFVAGRGWLSVTSALGMVQPMIDLWGRHNAPCSYNHSDAHLRHLSRSLSISQQQHPSLPFQLFYTSHDTLQHLKTNHHSQINQNDWRKVRRQGQRCQVQRAIVSSASSCVLCLSSSQSGSSSVVFGL
jgi:hypothetical protein